MASGNWPGKEGSSVWLEDSSPLVPVLGERQRGRAAGVTDRMSPPSLILEPVGGGQR